MTTKESYSQAEWTLLMNAPVCAGMAISALDFGIVSFAKEFSALVKAVLSAKEKYAGNELVQAVVQAFETSGQADDPPESGEKKSADDLLADLTKATAIVDA